MSSFEWTPKKNEAAVLLAQGYTIDETASEVGVSSRTIDRWKSDIEFSSEIDELSVKVGVANKAVRLRIANRIIKAKAAKEVPSKKDLLEWLKYAQGETEAAKVDLTTDGEKINSTDGFDKSLSKLADALREIIPGEGTKQNGAVDTPK